MEEQMEGIRLTSIPIDQIDMGKCCFNPGCALNMENPDAAQKLLGLLNAHFGKVEFHTVCCHHDPQLPQGSTIINNCAGCDRRFRSLYPGVGTISIWEVLDTIPNLPLPHYDNLTVSVHDSCSYRPKPQVHAAVRSLLNKMGISIVESEYSGTNSVCCGDNFYGHVPLEEVRAFQKKRAQQMPCQDVVVYCVSCVKSMAFGGKTPHHMTDLVLGEPTLVRERDLTVYHDALNRYIEAH